MLELWNTLNMVHVNTWSCASCEPDFKSLPGFTALYKKVKKGAKIRNRYNQVLHLTEDTNGKMTNSQLDTTNKSQEVSPFPAGDHKAHINRRAQRHSKRKTGKTSLILYWMTLVSKKLQRKIVNIFLPTNFNKCFGCSKEPSHWDVSFKYPKHFEYPQHMFWLRNKKFKFRYALLTKVLCKQSNPNSNCSCTVKI